MKKLLLIFSLIIPLCFSSTTIIKSQAVEEFSENTNCEDSKNSIVRIVDKYDIFKSNGFVYRIDELYTYILTTYDIVSNFNNYKVIYEDGYTQNVSLLGYDEYNQVAVLKTSNKQNINSVCLANTNHIYKGQLVVGYGYYNNSNNVYVKGIINQIGMNYTRESYINTFRSIVQIKNDGKLNGMGVFDELGRLIGMITGYDSKLEGSSYIVESNKLRKIADSIVKDGKYRINYIKYSLEDYSNLKSALKKSYGVSSIASSGVVITTFKPWNYVFGGLNQGMVIVAVNGVEVNNIYELDKQLTRYDKNDNVCLKVIKKNGKIDFYYVKV